MEEDIIDGVSVEQSYSLASKGKRLTNYIIDMVVYYILAVIGGALYAGFVMTEDELLGFADDDAMQTTLMDYVLGFTIIFLYYFLMELLFKGKTIGKFITKTRAVKINNGPLEAKDAALRSLTRIIPFETFSFLGDVGQGWHDKWTDTQVIEDINWNDY